MAIFRIKEVYTLGLDTSLKHVSTDWQAFENIGDDGTFGEILLINNDDEVNLLEWQHTFVKEDGSLFTRTDSIHVRARLKYSNGIKELYTDWFIFDVCGRRCGFVYDFNEIGGGAYFCIGDCNPPKFIYDLPGSFMLCEREEE